MSECPTSLSPDEVIGLVDVLISRLVHPSGLSEEDLRHCYDQLKRLETQLSGPLCPRWPSAAELSIPQDVAFSLVVGSPNGAEADDAAFQNFVLSLDKQRRGQLLSLRTARSVLE